MRTLVIGVGNPLRKDDAVGLHVARRVRETLGDDLAVEFAELWAGGLRLAEAMSGYERAVIIDAFVDPDGIPGAVRRVALSELGRARHLACAHDTSLCAALDAWRALGLALPRHISIWGIVAAETETLAEELSPPVARAVPVASAAVIDELRCSKLAFSQVRS